MKLIKRIKTIFGVDKQEQIIPKAEPKPKDTGASFFRETFILPFDELIVILPKTQEQSDN